VEEAALRMLRKHDQDLYQGNGKPALTVRMALAEKEIETVNKTVCEIREDSKAIKRMVLGAGLTTVAAVAADIIVRLVMHK
jgi:cob(I)alamin adenosyltransferase